MFLNFWEFAKIAFWKIGREQKEFIEKAHSKSRKEFNLPEKVPKTKNGVKCNLCANECQMGEGEFGYCGLRKNEKGKLISFVSKEKALLEYYYDILPTNCVAAPWCKAKEGDFNLAVFMGLAILITFFAKIGINFKIYRLSR